MSVIDPISDMLTRLRNAIAVKQNYVLMPHSRLKEAVAQVLLDEGYVGRYETLRDGQFPVLKVYLKYTKDREPIVRGLRRISKPGCRVYASRDEIPWVKHGLGSVILSTPRGVVSGRAARRLGVGGEILCEIW
jgi:small subunit ribosomal protein S8